MNIRRTELIARKIWKSGKWKADTHARIAELVAMGMTDRDIIAELTETKPKPKSKPMPSRRYIRKRKPIVSNHKVQELLVPYSDLVLPYREVCHIMSHSSEKMIRHIIHGMNYTEYLNTPYWKCISKHIRLARKKCECCGSTSSLQVHHTTYIVKGKDIKGFEYKYANLMMVLCESCHSAKHEDKKNIQHLSRI